MDPPQHDGDLDAEGEVDQLDIPQPVEASAPLAAASGVAKRYRPAQTKSYRCFGYGECNMVFSRSEHLARHIRKHTGERPFNCHCGKQFSRLDNLRQHAQTVHSDKPAENESMMRQLSALHATITGQVPTLPPAVTATATTKSGRASNGVGKAAKNSGATTTRRASTRRAKAAAKQLEEDENATEHEYMEVDHVVEPKQEPQPSPPLAARGSFRDDDRTGSSFRDGEPNGNHSFRDFRDTDQSFRADSGGQSFRAPQRQPTASPPANLVFNAHTSNGLRVASANAADPGRFPIASSGHGTAAAGLPSLASLVPAATLAFRRPSTGAGANSILLPNSLTLRRPSTGDWAWDGFGSRPGTAPGKLATSFGGSYGPPSAVDDASPFSFHPPDQSSGGNISNPRKRALSSAHGPYGAHPDDGGEYEYGSQSRPASRRVSVMELINDEHAVRPASAVSATVAVHRERDRPVTTNGLVSRASALVLDDDGADEREREQPRQRFAFAPEYERAEFAVGHGTTTGIRGRAETAAGSPVERGIADGAGSGIPASATNALLPDARPGATVLSLARPVSRGDASSSASPSSAGSTTAFPASAIPRILSYGHRRGSSGGGSSDGGLPARAGLWPGVAPSVPAAASSLLARGALPGVSSFGLRDGGDDAIRRDGLAGGIQRVRYGGGQRYDAYEHDYAQHAGPPRRQSGGMTA